MRYRTLHIPTDEYEQSQWLVIDTEEGDRYTRCEFIASCTSEWIARQIAATLSREGITLDEPF